MTICIPKETAFVVRSFIESRLATYHLPVLIYSLVIFPMSGACFSDLLISSLNKQDNGTPQWHHNNETPISSITGPRLLSQVTFSFSLEINLLV